MKITFSLAAICCFLFSSLLFGQQLPSVKIETTDKFGQPAFFQSIGSTLKPVDTDECTEWLRSVYDANDHTTYKLLRQYKSNDGSFHQKCKANGRMAEINDLIVQSPLLVYPNFANSFFHLSYKTKLLY